MDFTFQRFRAEFLHDYNLTRNFEVRSLTRYHPFQPRYADYSSARLAELGGVMSTLTGTYEMLTERPQARHHLVAPESRAFLNAFQEWQLLTRAQPNLFFGIFEPRRAMENDSNENSPIPGFAETVDNIPVVDIPSEQIEAKLQCSICMEEFIDSDKVKNLNCKHYFHTFCIVPWLNVRGTCPTCRKHI